MTACSLARVGRPREPWMSASYHRDVRLRIPRRTPAAVCRHGHDHVREVATPARARNREAALGCREELVGDVQVGKEATARRVRVGYSGEALTGCRARIASKAAGEGRDDYVVQLGSGNDLAAA